MSHDASKQIIACDVRPLIAAFANRAKAFAALCRIIGACPKPFVLPELVPLKEIRPPMTNPKFCKASSPSSLSVILTIHLLIIACLLYSTSLRFFRLPYRSHSLSETSRVQPFLPSFEPNGGMFEISRSADICRQMRSSSCSERSQTSQHPQPSWNSPCGQQHPVAGGGPGGIPYQSSFLTLARRSGPPAHRPGH